MSQATLVFIPGLLSDARVWQHTIDRVSLPIKVADLTQHANIPDMAAQILTSVDGPLIPVGHSMGGRVALEMARQSPERISALILANTGHGPQRPGEPAKRQEKIDLGHKDMAALIAEWLPPMLAEGREQDLDLWADLTDMALRQGPDVHERQIKALLGRPDAAAYIPGLACPILLMTGPLDRWSPVAQHEEIEAMAQDATLHIVPDAGHFLPIEQPEATTQTIQSWLRDQGLTPS